VDPITQYEKAIEAFEGNGFIVLVDNYQVQGLDDEIALHPETSSNISEACSSCRWIKR
jgi:hypothetical protein